MTETTTTVLDVQEIIKILPHRYPFLLVDRILSCDTEKGTIVAQKNLTINESFFQGHFPGKPIMPGVLIMESLAQAGGVLVHLRGQRDVPKIALLVSIKNARFRHPARPGDILTLCCQGIHFSAKGGRIQATAYVDGKVSAEGEMSFVLVDADKL